MSEPRPWSAVDASVFHLVPEPVWEERAGEGPYVPEAYEQDGFTHCTIGEANLIAVGNAFYRNDQRPYVAVVIDLDRVDAPVRYEDEGRIYPHVHGPLPAQAVLDVARVVRAADGSFVKLSDHS